MSDVIKRQYSINKDGVRYVVDLTIDVEQVARDMVNKAARNSSGKATQMERSIIAKVVDKSGAQDAALDAGGAQP